MAVSDQYDSLQSVIYAVEVVLRDLLPAADLQVPPLNRLYALD